MPHFYTDAELEAFDRKLFFIREGFLNCLGKGGKITANRHRVPGLVYVWSIGQCGCTIHVVQTSFEAEEYSFGMACWLDEKSKRYSVGELLFENVSLDVIKDSLEISLEEAKEKLELWASDKSYLTTVSDIWQI